MVARATKLVQRKVHLGKGCIIIVRVSEIHTRPLCFYSQFLLIARVEVERQRATPTEARASRRCGAGFALNLVHPCGGRITSATASQPSVWY
jgi:hypothetical protein